MKKIIFLLILLLLVIVNCVYQKSFDIYKAQNTPTSFYTTNILIEDKKPIAIQVKESKPKAKIKKEVLLVVKDTNVSKDKEIKKVHSRVKDTNISTSKVIIKEITKKVKDINKTANTLSIKEVVSLIDTSNPALKNRKLLLLEIENAIKKALKDRLNTIDEITNRNQGK